MNRLAAGVCLGLLLTAGATTTHAQELPVRSTVISANPFGLLLDFFNAEFERAIAPTATVGIGGSTYEAEYDYWDGIGYSEENARYVNADIFWRYYPSGQAFEGWNLGIKAGVTSIRGSGPDTEDGTYFGYGFDANRSWLLGPTDRLYIGIGFGLKRLIGAEEEFMKYIPTFRIVNVGFTF
jgi:hypothetical protein